MSRFTLQPRHWYAMLLLGDEFSASAMCYMSPSPTEVQQLTPLNTGKGRFKLAFFHANYPEGVQDKEYKLQTVHRGKTSLLATSNEHDPPRFLYITDITMEWLQHNFPQQQFQGTSPTKALNQYFKGDDG